MMLLESLGEWPNLNQCSQYSENTGRADWCCNLCHTHLLVSSLSSQEILSSAVSWHYCFKSSERREEDKGQGRSHKFLQTQRYLLNFPTHVQKYVEAVLFPL